MAKTILGVDIGYDSLKLALVNGKTVRKSAIVPMPKNLIREGRVVSTETMGELIRRTMKETASTAARRRWCCRTRRSSSAASPRR